METIRQSFQVNFNYDVHFLTGLFNPENRLLASVIAGDDQSVMKKAIVIIDDGVLAEHKDLLNKLEVYALQYKDVFDILGEPIILKGGENVKNDHTLYQKLHERINAQRICRHSYIIAIGGGALLDVVGLAAATAHRGIRLIRIPSTVLSQNDSGVGVKNGFNVFGKKNFVGTFAPPYAVLNDFDFLTTLDDRDWRSGIAEAVKVALIKDRGFFEYINNNTSNLKSRNMEVMKQVIYRCATLHLNHIRTSGDPFEHGSCRPLDFGHWAAHKIEQLSDYSIRHGEAVAIGIAIDTTYSYLAGLLKDDEWELVLETLGCLGFNLTMPQLSQWRDDNEYVKTLLLGMEEFREHQGGKLTLMMLKEVGQGININEVDESLFHKAILLINEFELKKVKEI